jgi:hypothetical protein
VNARENISWDLPNRVVAEESVSAIVRLLARQAAREWLAVQTGGTTTEQLYAEAEEYRLDEETDPR